MKTFTIGKRYTINDLNTATILFKPVQRADVKILIIDNENFIYEEELRSRGFNIHCINDVQNLELVNAYPIIISDIRGVGASMKMDKEGASLLRELRKKYPSKIFAAYSGSTFDTTYNAYLEGITIIMKGAQLDQWTDSLDLLIEKATNPIEKWKALRLFLLDKGIDLLELSKLEHEYVNIVLNKDNDFSNFPSKSTQKGINPELIKTIGSLAIDLAIKA
jgi:hypothetical protein